MDYVSQKQFKIADSNSEKPILYTYGISTCTGLVGISFKSKIAFLVHFDSMSDVENIFCEISNSIKTRYGDIEDKFQLYWCKGFDYSIRERILEYTNLRKESFHEYISNVPLIDGVGVNCKTKEVFIFSNYN